MNFKTLSFKIYALSILCVLFGQILSGQNAIQTERINGISFLGPQDSILEIRMFNDLKTTHANWIGLVPEALLDTQTLTLISDEQNSHWGNTIAAQIEAIGFAKSAGLKVFLKPHIKLKKSDAVLRKGLDQNNSRRTTQSAEDTWRGNLTLESEKDWLNYEKSYEAYILNLAHLADSLEVELFSIGTELRQFVVSRPAFWKQLINKVRQVYAGPITYCANWDEYNKVPFWSSLDYIGIDAYFPISKAEIPTIKKTMRKWKRIKRKLKSLSKKEAKPILLTEFGYRNIAYAGLKPWEHDKGLDRLNNEAQRNLYEAFFRTFWNETWVSGGFAWNWLHTDLAKDNTDFSIKNKPAFYVLKQWYK